MPLIVVLYGTVEPRNSEKNDLYVKHQQKSLSFDDYNQIQH